MAQIKINLLGKKKASAPFGLDIVLEKIGIKMEDFADLKMPALRVIVMALGFFLAEYIPNAIQEKQIAELDIQLNGLTKRMEAMQKELVAKKEIRHQMDQLLKEEAEINRQLGIISSLSKNRNNAFKTIESLTSLMTTKLWFNRIEYNDGKMTVEGASWEYQPVNDFIKSLSESLLFQSVLLKSMSAEMVGKPIPGIPLAMQKSKNFLIEMNLKDTN